MTSLLNKFVGRQKGGNYGPLSLHAGDLSDEEEEEVFNRSMLTSENGRGSNNVGSTPTEEDDQGGEIIELRDVEDDEPLIDSWEPGGRRGVGRGAGPGQPVTRFKDSRQITFCRSICLCFSILGAITVGLLFYFVLPCAVNECEEVETETETEWNITLKYLETVTSLKMIDIGNDGVRDILVGGEMSRLYHSDQCPPCRGLLMAVSSSTGQIIWKKALPTPVKAINCGGDHVLDADQDGVPDCLAVDNTRMILVKILDGNLATQDRTGQDRPGQARGAGEVFSYSMFRNLFVLSVLGKEIWKSDYDNSEGAPLYPLIVADYDGDKVSDIIETKTGNDLAGRLRMVSGVNGKNVKEPRKSNDGFHIHSPAILYPGQKDTEYIIFGTDNQTTSGSLWAMSVKDFYLQLVRPAFSEFSDTPWTNNTNLKPLYHFTQLKMSIASGVSGPVVLVDLNGDDILDFLVTFFNGTLTAFDGKTLAVLWINGDKQSNSKNPTFISIPAIGHFDNDFIPDLMITMELAATKNRTKQVLVLVMNGKNGEVLWATKSASPLLFTSSPLTLQTSNKNDAFLFWRQEEDNVDDDISELSRFVQLQKKRSLKFPRKAVRPAVGAATALLVNRNLPVDLPIVTQLSIKEKCFPTFSRQTTQMASTPPEETTTNPSLTGSWPPLSAAGSTSSSLASTPPITHQTTQVPTTPTPTTTTTITTMAPETTTGAQTSLIASTAPTTQEATTTFFATTVETASLSATTLEAASTLSATTIKPATTLPEITSLNTQPFSTFISIISSFGPVTTPSHHDTMPSIHTTWNPPTQGSSSSQSSLAPTTNQQPNTSPIQTVEGSSLLSTIQSSTVGTVVTEFESPTGVPTKTGSPMDTKKSIIPAIISTTTTTTPKLTTSLKTSGIPSTESRSTHPIEFTSMEAATTITQSSSESTAPVTTLKSFPVNGTSPSLPPPSTSQASYNSSLGTTKLLRKRRNLVTEQYGKPICNDYTPLIQSTGVISEVNKDGSLDYVFAATWVLANPSSNEIDGTGFVTLHKVKLANLYSLKGDHCSYLHLSNGQNYVNFASDPSDDINFDFLPLILQHWAEFMGQAGRSRYAETD